MSKWTKILKENWVNQVRTKNMFISNSHGYSNDPLFITIQWDIILYWDWGNCELTSKTMLQIPQVNWGHTTLKVHLAVLVESRIGFHLEFAQPLSGQRPILEHRVIGVAPWRTAKMDVNLQMKQKLIFGFSNLGSLPIRVTITVVITQEVVFALSFVSRNFEGLVDWREQVLAQFRHQVNEIAQILLNLLGWQAPHQVQCSIKLFVCLHCTIKQLDWIQLQQWNFRKSIWSDCQTW